MRIRFVQLECAGFETVAAYDNWTPAVRTYRANFGDRIHDIAITAALDLPDADVIVGGPPCQGFSSAGRRREDDTRNSLVGEFSRLIARHRPRAFVFENVEGFLTGANGLFVFELLEPLIDAGYLIHIRKVNAANYGVPQHRKRIIAVGGLGWAPSFPAKSYAAYGAPGAHLGNGRATRSTPSVIDAIGVMPSATTFDSPLVQDHTYAPLRGDDLKRAHLLQPGQRMRDLPEELWHKSYRKRAFRRVMDGTPSERRGGAPSGVRRLRPDEPSKAITSGAVRDFLHPTEHRPLTMRECAILQTFPIGFQFAGTQSEKMLLIGNAVPPMLAEQIARSLLNDLASKGRFHEKGALLSFVPTLSEGMSPALADVTHRVLDRFGGPATHQYVRTLWH